MARKVSRRSAFKTGYSDPEIVRAAQSMGELKGSAQKKKKDRMAYGVRYSNNMGIKTGKASRTTGVFLGADSQEDDSYAREMDRIQIAVGENGRIVEAFRN